MSYRALIYCSLFIFLLAGCASIGTTFTDNTGGYALLPDGTRLKIIKMVQPEYPPDLRRNGIGGIVIVQFSIQPDGTTSNVKVKQSSVKALDESAVNAVRQWQFEPYTAGSRPVVQKIVPITFSVRKH